MGEIEHRKLAREELRKTIRWIRLHPGTPADAYQPYRERCDQEEGVSHEAEGVGVLMGFGVRLFRPLKVDYSETLRQLYLRTRASVFSGLPFDFVQ